MVNIATNVLIKIANKITKVSRISPQNNSEIITNENEKEILKERCISSED